MALFVHIWKIKWMNSCFTYILSISGTKPGVHFPLLRLTSFFTLGFLRLPRQSANLGPFWFLFIFSLTQSKNLDTQESNSRPLGPWSDAMPLEMKQLLLLLLILSIVSKIWWERGFALIKKLHFWRVVNCHANNHNISPLTKLMVTCSS